MGLAVGALAVPWFAAARYTPDGVEQLYSRSTYPIVASALGSFSSFIPISVGEVVLVAIPIFLIWGIVRGWRAARSAHWSKSWSIVASLARGLARAGVIWCLFLTVWGLNYARRSPEELFQLTPPQESAATRALIAQIGEQVDRLRSRIAEDQNGVALMPDDLGALDRELEPLQAQVLESIGLPAIRTGRAKRFAASSLFQRWGVSGMYAPFTGEPQVVYPGAPTQLPFTLAHERAHLSGFAWEEAASFVALLSCWRSEDPRIQYSAWLSLWMTLRGGVDGREPGVRRDMLAISEFVRQHRGGESAAVWNAYSGFLSAHGVKGGRRSYGRVSGLALAWLEKNGIPNHH